MNGLKYFQEEEDPQLLDSLTQGTSAPMMAPVPKMPIPISPPPSPVQQPAEPPPPMQAPVKLPGMPSGVTPDEISGYLTKQRQNVNKFGPDQQMELEKNLLSRRDSLGSRLTSGAKGFADALMMGVARAGNPGWQQQYEGRQDQIARESMDNFKSAREGNLKQVEAGMSLDKMDPQSPLSQESRETYAPLFEKLGYPPEKLDGMSAANIESAMSLMTQFGGMEIQAAIKQYELEIERARLAAAGAKAGAEERSATENLKMQAAKELAGEKDNLRVGPIPVPFTKAPTAASRKGTEYLERKLSEGDAPAPSSGVVDVSSEEEAEALPPGSRFKLPDGRTGTVQ